MQIIAIKECADGNGVVGEMWKETKIFNGETRLKEVMDWAPQDTLNFTRNIILSIPLEEIKC